MEVEEGLLRRSIEGVQGSPDGIVKEPLEQGPLGHAVSAGQALEVPPGRAVD